MVLMEVKKERRRVNTDKLSQLGFSQKEIGAALRMQNAGLLEVEPSADLVERTIERCAAVLKAPKPKAETPEFEAPSVSLLDYCMVAKELSPSLRASAEWKQFSRLQELQMACLATGDFAQSRRERPFVMVDNHNLLDPSWWANDTGFHAFWNACQIANKMAIEAGAQPAQCLVVLRPDLEYSDEDLAVIDDMLRTGTSDLWWLPYDRAGELQAQDLIVLGEARTLQLIERPRSPVEAWEAFEETTNPAFASELRDHLAEFTRLGVKIRDKGELNEIAASFISEPDGIRKLMRTVVSESQASECGFAD